MLRGREKTINGGTYVVHKLPALPEAGGPGGLAIYEWLHPTVLKLVGSAADVGLGAGTVKDALGELGGVVASPEFRAHFKAMTATATYDGNRLDWKTHWDEHLADYHELALFCLEVNFRDAFRGSVARIEALVPRIKEKAEASPTLRTFLQRSPTSSERSSPPSESSRPFTG